MKMFDSTIHNLTATTLWGSLLATLCIVPACGEGIDTSWGQESATAGEEGGQSGEYNFSCSNRLNWVTGQFPCAGPGNGFCTYPGPDSGYHIPSVNACALISNPDDWEADDATIRAACSDTCRTISKNGYLCEDKNWIEVKSAALGNGLQSCGNGMEYNFDIDAFAARLGNHVAEAIEELGCDLNSSCAAAFSGPVGFAIATGADALTAAGVADTRALATLSSGADVGDQRVSLQGSAAYSVPQCDVASCPIYLGDLSLTAEIKSPFSLPGGGFEATSASAHLAGPVLGIWIPDDGSVIFPAGSLRLTTSAGVVDGSGTETEFDMDLVNEDPVYGSYADGALSIEHVVDSGTLPWSLSVTFEP